jgi:Ni/Co efflux regulator RcnB
MNVHRHIAGAIIVCVMASQSAFAHDYKHRGHDDRRDKGRSAQQDGRFKTERGYGYRYGHQPQRQYDHYRHPVRGAGPKHNWYKGTVLPAPYRTRHYVVNDWRHHHLHSPPRGYNWVQVGGDYMLAAIATGVILSVLLN